LSSKLLLSPKLTFFSEPQRKCHRSQISRAYSTPTEEEKKLKRIQIWPKKLTELRGGKSKNKIQFENFQLIGLKERAPRKGIQTNTNWKLGKVWEFFWVSMWKGRTMKNTENDEIFFFFFFFGDVGVDESMIWEMGFVNITRKELLFREIIFAKEMWKDRVFGIWNPERERERERAEDEGVFTYTPLAFLLNSLSFLSLSLSLYFSLRLILMRERKQGERSEMAKRSTAE